MEISPWWLINPAWRALGERVPDSPRFSFQVFNKEFSNVNFMCIYNININIYIYMYIRIKHISNIILI